METRAKISGFPIMVILRVLVLRLDYRYLIEKLICCHHK